MSALRAVLAIAAASWALAAPQAALAQASCSAVGSTSPASWTGIVNTYYAGTSGSAGSNSIGVGAIDGRGAATPIAAGDLLLIVQMQDASISTANSSAYGGSGSGQGYTSLNSSGLFEYATATGPVSAGSVPLAAPLVNSYHSGTANSVDGQKTFQVIRVPQGSSATLTGGLTAPPWNGVNGGVVAIDTAGNLNWNGQTIDVDGRGFRGGAGQGSGSDATGAPANAITDYVSNVGAGTLNASVPNGAKGEGIAGTPIVVFAQTTANSSAAGTMTNTGGTDGTSGGYPVGSFGRGAPGNGGGGGTDGDATGNQQNTGGAGGGNYGIGGKGGFGWTPGTPPGWDGGGMGGMSVPGGTARLFFGGGGGSGSTNNNTGTPAAGLASSGASGGGMVFVRAGTVSGGGTINARGTSANTTVLNDASGGGGAGGSALVFVNNAGGSVGATLNLQGGNGGCNTGGGTFTSTCGVPTGGSPHGPGGGGSGGFALLSGSATVNVAGGTNGITASSPTSQPDYGSLPSSGGFQIVSLTANQIPGAGSATGCFPQLTVTKSTSTPFVAAGTPATYTITVTNAAGKSAATGVSISDVLPANPNMTFASNTAPVLGGGATRTAVVNPAVGATSPAWGTFSIPGGGSVGLTFVANTLAAITPGTYQNPGTVTYLDPTRTAAQTVTPGGTYTAGGTVGGSNYNPASSTNEDVTVVAAPTIAKVFNPKGIAVGAASQMTVTINNPGTTTLTGAGLVDTYPAGMVNTGAPAGATTCGGSVTAAPGGTGFTLAGATLGAGTSCTVTVNVTITSAGAYTNTIAANALTNTQNVTNPSAASATLWTNPTIVKSFAPNAVPTSTDSTLTLALTNPNSTALTLTAAGLVDSFPANLVATGSAITYAGAGCAGFAPAAIGAGATTITLTAGTLPANGACTVSFPVRSATVGIYANTSGGITTVETASTGPASNTANLGVGLINIAKAFAPASIVSGGASTLTFTLTNPTGVAQTAGAFTDTLANMSVSANQNTGGTCAPVTALTAGQTALSFSGLNIPAAGCTITLTVTSATVGAQPNTSGGVTTALLPAGPTSNTATLNVLAKPTIAKAFAPSTIQPGSTSTLTFTLTNPGPLGLTGMSFTDTYAAGLVNATPLTVGGSCAGVTTTAAAGGGTFNVTAGNIPAGASCTITVLVTAAATGTYSNTASGVATTQTGGAGTGSNTATLFVANPPTIAKAFGTSPISQGGTSVITFTLTNGNTIALTNANFTDALTGMSVSNATIGGTCAGTTNTPALVVGLTALNLTVPTIAAGASCTVTVTVTSSTSGTWPNTTSGVTSTQTPTAGSTSNTANLVVLSPPSLTKGFVSSSIQTGGTASIVFTLTNPNPSTALTTVVWSDTLVNMQLGAAPTVVKTCSGTVTPTGVAAASTSFSLSLNTLAAGETCTITVSPVTSSVMSAATGHPNTTSTVNSTEASINRGAAATGNLIVYAPPTVTKVFSPNSIASGGTSVVTFTITNPNPLALTDVRITDDLPTNLTNTAAQSFIGGARGTCVGTIPNSKVAGNVDPITFASTNMAANSSCTIMMDVTSSTVGSYTNTVTNITSNQTPTATTGGSDNLAVGRIQVTKAFSVASIQTGGTATMSFTIVNNSGANRTGLTFTDAFPAGLVAVGGAVTTAGTCTNFAPTTVVANAAAYNLTALDLNNGVTCTLSFPVSGTTSGIKTNTVNGTAPAQFLGATDTASISVFSAPTIAKAFVPATILAGGTSTLTLTLTNPNAFGALTGAAFTDTLTNMSVSGAQAPGGTCSGTLPASLANGATALSFTGINIPSGGSCTVTVVVTSSTPGVLPNTASGITTTQTPTVGTNSGAVNLTVAGINISKAFSPATRPLGASSTLTFTLTSTQAIAWTGLAFTDTLATNLVVANPANAVTTCGAGAITATPGSSTITLAGGTMASGASPCTVSVDVVSSNTATYTNNAGNLSAMSPGMAFSGAAATVQYFPNATLSKAFAPTAIAANGTTVLTFTLTNPAGALAVSGLGFTDTLPANVVVAAAPGGANTCGATFAPVAGATSVTLTGGSLAAGVATCTATVNVTSSVLGTYVNNSSNVGALAGGLTAATANASFSVVGTTLAKAFNPTTIGANATSQLTFTITNGAGAPAQAGLAFTDTLPANLVVATPNGLVNSCGGAVSAVAGSGTISLAGGALAAAAANCTFSVNVTSALAGVYTNNNANITGTSATLDDSGVLATLNVLSIPTAAKTFGATFLAPGGSASLTLTFTNVNNAAVTGLAFTDVFPVAPAAMTLFNTTTSSSCGGALTDSGGGALGAGDVGIRLTGGTIPANGSCAVTVNITAPSAGAYTNTIAANTITTTNGGTIPTATSGSITVPTAPSIAKSFASPMGPGRTTTLTFTITNANTGTSLTGVAFSDTFPVAPGAMVVAGTPAATTSGCGAPTFAPVAGAASIAFSGGTIAVSGTCTVTVDVTAPATGSYNNTSGNVTATGPVALTGNTASATLVVVQPALTKAFGTPTIDVGGVSVLTFTLTNGAGNPAQSGINFVDTLPGNVLVGSPPNITSNCPSGAGAVAATAGTGTITVTGASMSNAQASCTITVDTTSAVPGTYNNTNAANISAAARVDTTGVSSTLTVRALPLLIKAFSTATVGIGQTTTLVFTVDNTVTNATNRAGMSFTDTLPTGIAIANPAAPVASASCGAPTFTAVDATQPFTATGIAVTAGQICTITLTVRGTALGAAVNGSGQITASSGVNNGVTNQTLTVVQSTAAKAFGAASINDNATTTLVFTLTNGAGNPAEGGIALGDTLPASLRLNSATPAVAYSAGCSGPASAAYNAGARVLSGLTGIAMTAGTASCTVTVSGLTNLATAVNASCAGNPAAFTNLAASVTTTNATNGATDQCLVVNRINPTVAKTFAAGTIADGAATSLVFTLTNSGSNPAQSAITLGDTLPTGLRLNSATPAVAYSAGCSGPAAAAYNAGTRVVSGLTGIAMTAGTASCTVTLSGLTNTATQTNASCAANPAAFTNLAANVTATNAAPGGSDQCLVVTQTNAGVAKTFGAGTIADGATTTLVFTLTNTGTNPAQSAITLGDTLPAGLRLNSATPAVAYSGGCSGPAAAAYNAGTRVVSGLTGIAMTAGTASCTVTLSGLTNTATQTNASCAANPAAFTNLAANVTATNAIPGGADQCLVVTQTNPSVAKTFLAGTIADTATTSLVFTLTNTGTNPPQSGVALGDTLPSGLRFNSATPALAYSAGCSGPATAAYNAGTRVLSGISAAAMSAGTASCTVTVAGLTNAATQVSASCAGNPAAFTNLSANVTTTAATNTSTDQCLVVTSINPTVAKTFGAGTIADGAATTLVFTLANQGSNPAQSGITVGDTLPTGLALNSATPAVAYSAGCSGPAAAAYNAGTRVLSGLTGIAITSGTVSCTATVAGLTNAATQVNASCAGNPAAFTNLAASVTTTAATNASTDQCLVVTKANASVAKTFGAASFVDGAATTLVFTLTNSGTNPAQSAITIGDTLPTGLALNSATPAVAYSAGCSGPATGAYNAGTRVVSGLTGIAMTAGTAACTVTVSGLTNQASQVNASCVGNPAAFTNLAASVTATNATPGGSDQCVTVTKTNPTVAKTFAAGTIADGASTSLVFTLTNTGTNPAQSAITLGDTLPTGLALNSATPAVAYSAGCSGPATGAYNAGTRVVSGLTGIAMTAGTAACTVTVAGLTNQATQVNASCAGNPAAFTNLAANVTATSATPGGADQCLVVTKANPTVAKTFAAGTIADGAATSLVFTLTNSGTNPAQSAITVGDTLPAGLAINSATPAVAYSAGCSGPATATYTAGTRVLSGLTGIAMASGTASCTITVSGLTNAATQTNASCAGNPVAFTNLAANVTAANATPGGGDQCLVVTRANPTVAKTFGAGTIADGATTTLVFTLTNSGTNPAQSPVTIGDTLPTGLALNSATPTVAYSAGCSGPATTTYAAGTRVISGLTGVAMTAGTSSCTVTLSGLTNQAAQTNTSCAGNPAAFTNLAANVTATNATPGGTDQCLVVTKSGPTVAKTFGAGTIADGAATTLVFTLTNSGTNPAQSAITLGDTLPTGLALNSATPAVAYSAGCSGPATATYTAGTRVVSGLTGIAMTSGTASCTVTVSGLTNQASQVNASCAGNPAAFTNLAANVTATNATPGGADQCLVVTKANPTVAKTFGAGTIADGAATTLVFTLTNAGTNPAQAAITLGDTLPTSLRLNSATPAVAYSAGCSGPAAAAYTAGTRVVSGLTGIAMTAGTASCTVTLSGLTNVATQTNASCVGNPAAFTNLAANVTATNATPGGGDQCLVVTKTNPTVAKTFGAGAFADGATTTLVFTLTNSGTSPAQSAITLGDTLPTGLALNGATPAVAYSAGCSGPATGTYTAGTRVISGLTGIAMTAGTASCTVTLSGLTNQVTQTNASCVGNPAAFTNLAANVTATNATPGGSDQCVVVTKSGPTVAKTFGAGTIADGAATTLVFTLSNAGTNPAQSAITLGDTLPTGLALNSATPAVAYSGGCSGPATATYTAGTRVISGLGGIAMTSGTASCTVTLSGLTNQATQTSASCVGNPAAFTNLAANVTAANATPGGADQCLVVTKANPTVAKTFGAGTIADGATTTLVFTLTNNGTNPAQSAITLGDTLPTGLALNSATPAVAYSAGCSGPATATYTAGTRVISGLTGIAMTAGTASCTVTLSGLTNQATQTNASCVGNPAAFTNLAANVTATNATPGGGDQCLVVTKANPTVAKTFGTGTIADGATTTLVLTLTNSGSNPAQSAITVGDTLPTGLALNSATPAVAYSAGCSGPATAAYNAGTRVLSGLTGVAMTSGTASCTVTLSGLTNAAAQTNASCVGNPAAFTNLAANVTATNATPGGADQCLVVTKANPTVAKTFGTGTIADGAATTLLFTLTNGGTNPAQSAITIGDTLPTGLALSSATPAVAYSAGCSGPATATYTAGTRVLSGLTGIAMASGTASCSVTVSGLTNAASQVNASCVGNPAAFTNLAANVTATNATPGGGDQCLVVTKANPTVAKTFGAASISDASTTTLVFTLTNSGTNPAQSAITLGDTLPTGLALNSTTPAVAYSAGCSGPAAAVYTVGTRVISGLTGIAMTAGTGSCTVTLSGLTNAATQTNASCVGNPAAFTNLAANVTATNATPGGADQCLVVTKANATVAKTFGAGTIADGAATTLVFTLTNSGTNPAQSAITLGDMLPTGLALNSATPAVAYSAGCSGPATATYTGGTRVISGLTGIAMSAGTTSCTVTLSGLANQATQTNASCVGNPAAFTNLAANVTATNATPGGGDQCLVVTKANPSVAKTFGTGTIADGTTTTLVFTLTNNGTNPAQSAITVGDTLPTGLALSSATPAVAYSAGCSGPATATYTVGTRVISGLTGIAMASGTASCSVTLSGLTNAASQVNASCVGNPAAFTNLAANVTATNATPGGADQCLVVTKANPTVAKTFGAGTIADGATTTLVFTLTNNGTNPAQSAIALGDTLPTSLRLNSATPAVAYSAGCSGPATATYTVGTRVVSGLTGIAMSAGTASCTVTLSGLTNVAAQTNASCVGNPAAFTNLAANVTATNATPGGIDQCLVVNAAVANLTKAFSPTPIDQGASSTLVFTLANSGTNPAQSGINFVDTLPANVSVAGVPAVQSNCPAGGALAPAPAFVATSATAITVTAAAINAGVASCEIRVNVTSNVPGNYANTNAANITGAANVTTTGVNATLVVQALPGITKAFGAAALGIGQATTLAFTIDNTGTNAANRAALAFTDTLPAGLETANPPVATTTAGCLAPTLTGTANASTAIGASSFGVNAGQVCTITFTLRATTVGTKTNNAASVTTTGILNNVTPQVVTVVQASLDKAFSPTTINVGQTSTLTFTLTNGAGNPAQAGISFSDSLPGNVIVAATPNVQTNCPAGAGFGASGFTVTAAAGATSASFSSVAMTSGVASCQVRVDVTSNVAGSYTNNSANVTAAGITNSVTPSTLTVNAAAPTITKAFAPATIASGATSTLAITIANTNNVPVTVTSVTDTFPTTPGTGLVRAATPAASTTCASGIVSHTAGSVTLTGGTVPANGSCSFRIDVQAANAGTYTNTIAAGALTSTAGANAAPASANLVVTPMANLGVAKSGPATVGYGATATYTIVVSNAGPDAANSATFSDIVPAKLGTVAGSCGSPTGGAACGAVNVAGNAVTSTITTLPAGGSVTFTVSGVAIDIGSFTNTATIAPPAGTTDPVAANDSSSAATTILAPDLTITKAHAGSFTIGANGTYTITVANAGTLATSGTITVTDTLPTGLGFVSATGTNWACANAAGTITCTTSNAINPAASAPAITLVVSVASVAAPAVTNFASVGGGNEPPALANNNQASDNTIVVAAAVNTFVPSGAQTAMPGTVVFYPHTFTAGLAGSVSFATSAIITPPTPGWTQLIYRDTNCNGVLDGAEGNAPLTTPVAVVPGDTVCIVVKDSIPATAPYNSLNKITVTATFGAQAYTVQDVTTVGAVAGAGLTLTKSVRNVTLGGAAGTANTARPNDVLEYTITYTNTSPAVLSAIVVTDATPAFTLYLSAACPAPPPNLTSCTVTSSPAVGATGSVVWTLGGTLLSNGSGNVSYQVRVAP